MLHNACSDIGHSNIWYFKLIRVCAASGRSFVTDIACIRIFKMQLRICMHPVTEESYEILETVVWQGLQVAHKPLTSSPAFKYGKFTGIPHKCGTDLSNAHFSIWHLLVPCLFLRTNNKNCWWLSRGKCKTFAPVSIENSKRHPHGSVTAFTLHFVDFGYV